MTFASIVARYRAALPDGIFFHFPMTAIDYTGIPAWSNVYLPGPLGGGDGYGASDPEAEVGTYGELHERLQSLWVVPTLPTEAGSYDDMVKHYGEAFVVDPLTLGLPAGSDYQPAMPRLWVKVQRFPSGEKLILLEAAASSPAELPADYQPLFLPITNGLGAGLDVSRGLTHGVFELLQRDGNSVNYRALDQGKVVDLTGAPADVMAILEQLQAAGLHVNVKLASTDFGLVNLYVNGYGPDDDHPQIKLTAGGEACALDRTAALRKALLEYAFSRARLAFGHGPTAAAAKVAPPDYFPTYRSYWQPVKEEPRALDAMVAWLQLSPAQLKKKLARIYHERERVDWSTLPTCPPLAQAEPAAQLAAVAERLQGFDILYSVMASPRAKAYGVCSVKVIIPGLEVETASYARIGERNLTRLLERNSPLVGLGGAPPGAERIRLPAAAQERIGDAAWFHTTRMKEVVGDLYPLYREPSHHAAPFVKEG